MLYVRGCQLADGSGSAPPDTEVRPYPALTLMSKQTLVYSALTSTLNPNSNTAGSDLLSLGLNLRPQP